MDYDVLSELVVFGLDHVEDVSTCLLVHVLEEDVLHKRIAEGSHLFIRLGNYLQIKYILLEQCLYYQSSVFWPIFDFGGYLKNTKMGNEDLWRLCELADSHMVVNKGETMHTETTENSFNKALLLLHYHPIKPVGTTHETRKGWVST